MPDGKSVVYRHTTPAAATVFEHDVDSGTRRELVRGAVSLSLSPDGRHLAYVAAKWQLMMLPTAGGEPREVSPQGLRKGPIMVMGWTPDSRALLVRSLTTAGDPAGLWLISPDGGQLRKVALNIQLAVTPPRFNPRTSQVAVTGRLLRQEVWALEHFLPGAKAPAARRQDR